MQTSWIPTKTGKDDEGHDIWVIRQTIRDKQGNVIEVNEERAAGMMTALLNAQRKNRERAGNK